MENSRKVRISPFTWVFLVLAVIMAIMAVYFFQDAMKYVTEYAESYGITVKDMGSDAVKYVMNAFLPYCIYTLIMLGFAAALYEISKLRASLYEEPEIEEYIAAAALAAEAEDAALEAEAEDAALAVEAEDAALEAEAEDAALAAEAAAAEEAAEAEVEEVVGAAEEAVEAETEEEADIVVAEAEEACEAEEAAVEAEEAAEVAEEVAE